MSSIDRQRVAAVRTLEKMGYTFANGEWMQPTSASVRPNVGGDALYVRMVLRADELAGCARGWNEERELAAVSAAIEAFEDMRWINGRIDGGK